MAGTRTVYRGSRGRFAGASGGKAEKVRVGSGYVRGTSASAGNARPKPGRITQMRNARAAKRQANSVKPLNPNVKPRNRPVPARHNNPAGLVSRTIGSKAPGKVKFARNLAIGVGVGAGVGYLGGKGLNRAMEASHTRARLLAGSAISRGALGDRIKAAGGRPSPYRGIGVGRKETVSMPKTALRADAVVGGRSVKSGAFVGEVGKVARAMTGTHAQPNYGLAKGKKEYVGRRLKPGEGRGFKLAHG